eukprot:gene994-532_t
MAWRHAAIFFAVLAIVSAVFVLVGFIYVFPVDKMIEAEQIHIAFGKTPDQMSIQWAVRDDATCSTNSLLHFSQLGAGHQIFKAPGSCRKFDLGNESDQLKQSLHVVRLFDLKPSTRYQYRIDNSATIYTFKTAPDALTLNDNLPQRFLVWGDMGSSKTAPTNTSTIMPYASQEVAHGDVDMIIHVGDFAYDFPDENGEIGVLFMNEIQNMSALVPYHTDVGNHEAPNNFAHYTEYFANMPIDLHSHEYVTTDNGVAPNNWFYSHNLGLIHSVSVNTNFVSPWWEDPDDFTKKQTEWLKNDLKIASENRTAAPWIIVHGHHSFYCTMQVPGDCREYAKKLRDEFEGLFFEYGVDLWFNGHEHNYERNFDVAPFEQEPAEYSGKTTKSTTNPPATVYIVTGDAGNRENHAPFMVEKLDRIAFRMDAFGNLHWEQVECDFSKDVDDEIWPGHRV